MVVADKTQALEQREIGLEVTLLKAELESEKSKSEFGFNVALGLVRNSVFRKSLIDSKTLPNTTETIIHLKIRFKILMKLLLKNNGYY
jgi:hypothetical protein